MGSQPARWTTAAVALPLQMSRHREPESAPVTKPGCSEPRVKKAWMQHPLLDHRQPAFLRPDRVDFQHLSTPDLRWMRRWPRPAN